MVSIEKGRAPKRGFSFTIQAAFLVRPRESRTLSDFRSIPSKN